MAKFYTYGKQTIEQDDIDAVVEVLKGDWLTQGSAVIGFEESLKNKFKSKYCTVVSSGTAALHLIGLALGWKKGDIVITTPITFLASANSILYAGATPDFVDINDKTYTIDVGKLEEKILFYKKENKRIKAVVAIDFAGHPSDWKSLRNLADKYQFQLVNDNCHAPNAEIDGESGYAVKYADAAAMSFHPVKHITTGEGGAILTNNIEIDGKIKMLRTHGMTKNEKYLTKNDGPWYYEMQELGFNYRITDFQCALGTSQLKKLDNFVNKRNEIAKYYDYAFNDNDRFTVPFVAQNVKHVYHLYPLQVKFDELEISKKDFFNKMRENNIGLQVHYIPVHLQPYYRDNFGFSKSGFPISENFYEREISIPMYPKLATTDLEYIVKTIKELVI